MLREWLEDVRWYLVDHRKTLHECSKLNPNDKVYKTADLLHSILDPARNTFTVRCNANEVVLSYRVVNSKTKVLTNSDVDFCAGIAKTMLDATTHSRLVGKDVQLRFDSTLKRVERAQETEAVRQSHRCFWHAVAFAGIVYLLLKLSLLIGADALELYGNLLLAWKRSSLDEEWEYEDELETL